MPAKHCSLECLAEYKKKSANISLLIFLSLSER